MHDSVTLEAKGLPTAVIVTTEFTHEAAVQREALGMNDLAPVVIDHPLSSLTEAEINQRIEQALGQVVRIWTGRQGS